jgi:hypothetical protein
MEYRAFDSSGESRLADPYFNAGKRKCEEALLLRAVSMEAALGSCRRLS